MLNNYYDILTVQDLMDILFISQNKAYDLLRKGEIRGFKCGSVWKIPRIEVEEYLNYKTGRKKAFKKYMSIL